MNIRPIPIMIYLFGLIDHNFSYFYLSDKNFVTIINIMLYTPKIDDYLEILTDKEVKDLVAINFS